MIKNHLLKQYEPVIMLPNMEFTVLYYLLWSLCMYWALVVGINLNTFRRRSRDRSFSSTGVSQHELDLGGSQHLGGYQQRLHAFVGGIFPFRPNSILLCSTVMRTALTTTSKETVDPLSVDVMVGVLLALVVYRIAPSTDADNVQYRAGSWRVEHTFYM
jgi:hypothetical protein